MTVNQMATAEILDDLFGLLPPLEALTGFERDRLREEARRLVEARLEKWMDRGDDDDFDC